MELQAPSTPAKRKERTLQCQRLSLALRPQSEQTQAAHHVLPRKGEHRMQHHS